MITVKDVHEMLSSTPDKRIDFFIQDRLVKRYINEKTNKVRVDCRELRHIGTINYVKNQFVMRGFSVRYGCDDRPCARPYYEIELPPKEE